MAIMCFASVFAIALSARPPHLQVAGWRARLPLALAGRGRGGATLPQQGRGRGRTQRREQLNKLCTAIRRKGDWAQLESLLSASPTGWGRGETAAMCQAAAQVDNWKMALRVLEFAEHTLQQKGNRDAVQWAVRACARASRPDEGRLLLRRQAASGRGACETRAYNQVITAYANARQYENALALLEELSSHGAAPSVVSFNAALSACSKAGRWRDALELLDRMEAGGAGVPKPDVVSYSTAASACKAASASTLGVSAEHAVSLLSRMENAKVRGNAATYTSTITALVDSGQWEEALRAYREIPRGIERDDAVINAAVSAAAAGGAHLAVRGILEEALLCGLAPRRCAPPPTPPPPPPVHLHSISPASHRSPLHLAMHLAPRSSSFNMAISCCGDAAQPAAALALLRRMMRGDGGAQPNLLSFNAALRAIEPGGR